MRLRNSVAFEAGLAVVVFLIGRLVWVQVAGLQSDTWYATLAGGTRTNTPAGFWYQFVSIPITQFLLLRWIWRLVIWWRFLGQVSRLDLNLVPTHPDRSCGLGFLDAIVFAMAPFLLSQTCQLSGHLANRILWEGSRLPDHYVEIGVMLGFLVVIALGPLCAFTPCLLRAKILGKLRYGRLASEYVIDFDRKWIGGARPPGETLIGTADIQSLADLANSYSVVQSIIPVPFGKGSLAGLVAVTVLPLLPLALTMF